MKVIIESLDELRDLIKGANSYVDVTVELLPDSIKVTVKPNPEVFSVIPSLAFDYFKAPIYGRTTEGKPIILSGELNHLIRVAKEHVELINKRMGILIQSFNTIILDTENYKTAGQTVEG